MTTTPMPELKPCPFCNWQPPIDDLRDVLYPSGIYRRADVNFHHYVSMNQSQKGDEPCWQMGCTENMGGCGALINADSREEVITKWNTRAAIEASQRQPLTVAEITDLWDAQLFNITDLSMAIDFVRDVEDTHGITPPQGKI